MSDLLLTRVGAGITRARYTDPFDQFEIHRIERGRWKEAPTAPGIYVLHGLTTDGKLTVYIGMSTTNIRDRIAKHHVTPQKNWFGVIFAVPLPNALLCPPVEAELIGLLEEANAVDVVVDNTAREMRMRGGEDVHVEAAVEKIRDALQLLFGADLFTPVDVDDPVIVDTPVERATRLARVYKQAADGIAERDEDDPGAATHRWVGSQIEAWGHFEAEEPDTRFTVLSGSSSRPANVPAETAASYTQQQRLAGQQLELVQQGVIDQNDSQFLQDHTFDNWSIAARVVGGGAYSGSYHWKRIAAADDLPAAG